MSLVKGFLALFPVRKKGGVRREFECEGAARALELIRAERSSNGSAGISASIHVVSL